MGIEGLFPLYIFTPLGVLPWCIPVYTAYNRLFVDSRHVTGSVQCEDKHDLHQFYLPFYYRKPLLQESW